jgi:hypothetical protein
MHLVLLIFSDIGIQCQHKIRHCDDNNYEESERYIREIDDLCLKKVWCITEERAQLHDHCYIN